MGRRRLPHLTRRNGTFYFRMALPRGLSSEIGRREIKLSLQTSDPAIARRRCRALSNWAEQILAQVSAMPNPITEQLHQLTRTDFEEQLDRAKEFVHLLPQNPGLGREYEISLVAAAVADYQHRLVTRIYSEVERATADRLLGSRGITLHPADERYEEFCHGLLRGLASPTASSWPMLTGQYHDTAPKDPLFKGTREPRLPSLEDSPEPRTDSLKALAAKYIELKSATVWVPKTRDENARVLDLFAELVGSTKPITEITKEDARDFRDALLKLPANYSKLKTLKGMALKEILAKSLKAARLSEKTRRKYLENLRAFLNWCVDERSSAALSG